jgi:hypothetical protein
MGMVIVLAWRHPRVGVGVNDGVGIDDGHSVVNDFGDGHAGDGFA